MGIFPGHQYVRFVSKRRNSVLERPGSVKAKEELTPPGEGQCCFFSQIFVVDVKDFCCCCLCKFFVCFGIVACSLVHVRHFWNCTLGRGRIIVFASAMTFTFRSVRHFGTCTDAFLYVIHFFFNDAIRTSRRVYNASQTEREKLHTVYSLLLLEAKTFHTCITYSSM